MQKGCIQIDFVTIQIKEYLGEGCLDGRMSVVEFRAGWN